MEAQKNRLLGAMSDTDIREFFSELHPVTLTFRKIIFDVGVPLEHVYFIEYGIVSILTRMRDGTSIEAGMIGSEGVSGLPVLFGDEKSRQRVIVQAPGTALRMDAAKFITAFNQNTEIRNIILKYTGTLLRTANQTAACNRLHSIVERTSRWLLMMHDRLQTDQMPLTHEFLATMLGVQRTRVTEAARELQRTGVIRHTRGVVTIIDHPGLLIAACECYRHHDRLDHV